MSTATFTLTMVASTSCAPNGILGATVVRNVDGTRAISEPAAVRAMTDAVGTLVRPFPDQYAIDAHGKVLHAGDVPGGRFQLFHDGRSQGLVRVHHLGGPDERITQLECCASPAPGDVLVRHTGFRYVELVPTVSATRLTVGSSDAYVAGAGLGLRTYAFEHGLTVGFTAEVMRGRTYGVGLLSGELGWGLRLPPRILVSANLGLGGAIASVNDDAGSVSTWAPQVTISGRAIYDVTRWFYVGGELGYARSGRFGGWDGGAVVPDVTLMGPIVRVFAGYTLGAIFW